MKNYKQKGDIYIPTGAVTKCYCFSLCVLAIAFIAHLIISIDYAFDSKSAIIYVSYAFAFISSCIGSMACWLRKAFTKPKILKILKRFDKFGTMTVNSIHKRANYIFALVHTLTILVMLYQLIDGFFVYELLSVQHFLFMFARVHFNLYQFHTLIMMVIAELGSIEVSICSLLRLSESDLIGTHPFFEKIKSLRSDDRNNMTNNDGNLNRLLKSFQSVTENLNAINNLYGFEVKLETPLNNIYKIL